jgi:hypothetical protein
MSPIISGGGSGGGGSGTVTQVSSANTSIAVATGTTTPVLTLAAPNVTFTNNAPAASVPMNSQKFTGLANGSAATDSAAFGQIPTLLTPTAVKTSGYSAAVGDLVACDISGGSFTVTLPTAPADRAQICVEIVARVTTGAPTYATIATGGSDVLFKAGGATSGIMGRGSVVFQYNASGAIWYAPGTGDLLPTGWEFGYDQITAASTSITSTTPSSGTTVISAAAHVFDGAPVIAQFYCPQVQVASAAGFMVIQLYEGVTAIGLLGVSSGTGTNYFPGKEELRFTPTSASHTYTVTAYVNANSGTNAINSGAAGTSIVPSFIRFTKA